MDEIMAISTPICKSHHCPAAALLRAPAARQLMLSQHLDHRGRTLVLREDRTEHRRDPLVMDDERQLFERPAFNR